MRRYRTVAWYVRFGVPTTQPNAGNYVPKTGCCYLLVPRKQAKRTLPDHSRIIGKLAIYAIQRIGWNDKTRLRSCRNTVGKNKNARTELHTFYRIFWGCGICWLFATRSCRRRVGTSSHRKAQDTRLAETRSSLREIEKHTDKIKDPPLSVQAATYMLRAFLSLVCNPGQQTTHWKLANASSATCTRTTATVRLSCDPNRLYNKHKTNQNVLYDYFGAARSPTGWALRRWALPLQNVTATHSKLRTLADNREYFKSCRYILREL